MPRPKYTDRQVCVQLGHRVQQAREKRGWTREQLAEALGLEAVQTIWKYETGRLAISTVMIYRIAAVLGLPVEALVTDGAPTTAEAELLAAWRRLDSKEQEMLLHLTRRLSERLPKPPVQAGDGDATRS